MLYNVKEGKLNIGETALDYITFGTGAKPLVMIQGLNTRGIKGAGLPLAYTYRLSADLCQTPETRCQAKYYQSIATD